MNWLQKNGRDPPVCLTLAIPSWITGKRFPVIGGAVIAILLGMGIGVVWSDKGQAAAGIRFTSKVVLQLTAVLLGFGMNLGVVVKTGSQSFPTIVCTTGTALLLAWLLCRLFRIPGSTVILVGVDSSICGGSVIAATAPVVGVDDDEVAQAISVIFFFNVLAAIFFPMLGHVLGFNTTNGGNFGLFVGVTANDTSSVTAATSTWDSIQQFGDQTLDKTVTVRLTRTLAVIPIALILSLFRARATGSEAESFNFRRIFSIFILYFILAALITTVALQTGLPASAFRPLEELSKFYIVMIMAAVNLNSDFMKFVRSGGKPLLLGAIYWGGVTATSLSLQRLMF